MAVDSAPEPDGGEDLQPMTFNQNLGIMLLKSVNSPLERIDSARAELKDNSVVITFSTMESCNSPQFKNSILALETQGCTVILDRLSNFNSINITITAPQKLFSQEVIGALAGQRYAREVQAQQAEIARRARGFVLSSKSVGC